MQSVANANGQPKPHANCHSDGYRHGDSNCNSYGYSDGNGNGHSHSDGDSNTNCDRSAAAYTDATASGNTAASPLGGSGKSIVHSAAGIERSRLRCFW